jgi:hypothetical protein
MNIEQALEDAPLCRQLTKVKALSADFVPFK